MSRLHCSPWMLTGLMVVGTVFPSAVHAVQPSTSYIFPAGAQRGTSVEVRVGGLYLHDGCHFRMSGPGVKVPERIVATDTLRFPKIVVPQSYFPQENLFPRDYRGQIEVAPDARLGMRYWQVWTAQGATPPRRFMIGDLPEVLEQEIDGGAIPQDVQLPVTVNGRIYPRDDVDVWSFQARAGQTISCEVHAARLGSTLDSFLEVRNADGQRIAENTDHFGSDSFLRFTPAKTGTYSVHIHDVRLGGLQSSVYRLTMTAGPYVDTTYPLGGRRGDKVHLQVLGQQTPDEPVRLLLPVDGPTDYRTEVDMAGTNQTLHLDLGHLPEALEAEPNNAPSEATGLEAPIVLNGRIGEPGDVDCWSLKVKKGDAFQFEFRGRRPGSLLNPLLIISDAAGKILHQSENTSQFRFPEEGTYHLSVKERFQPRGGPQFIYRMKISPPPAPNFRLRPAQQALTLLRSGSTELTVNAERVGGFAGAITLAVDDLPDGVVAEKSAIPAGKNKGKVKLTAGPKTRIAGTRIRIRGTTEIDGRVLSSYAKYQLDPGEPEIDSVLLATTLPVPFKFTGKYELPFALRGTTHYRRYQIDRGGFQGTLHARSADAQIRHQWGTSGIDVTVPPDASEFDFPLKVSTWTKVGLTGRTVIMLVGEIEDFDGSKHIVAFSSITAKDQVMIQPSAGPLSIEVAQRSIIASADTPAQIPVAIRRDPELQLPVSLSLVTGKHMRGIEATPVEIPAGQDRGILQVRFTADAGPFNMPIVIRATAQAQQTLTVRGRPLRGGDPIIAEDRVSVVVPK